MPDKKKILFDALSQDEVYKDKVGTEEEFYKKLNDPTKAKMLYGALSQDEVYKEKVGSEEDFYNKIGLKKKGSTNSKSSDGTSLSQDDIFSQLQSNIKGQPEDFILPTADKKRASTNIQLGGRQMLAQKTAQEAKQAAKKAQAHGEAANVKASMKYVKLDEARATGNTQAIQSLTPEYEKELKEIEQSNVALQEANDVYNKAIEESKKIDNYFIKQAKLIDTKAKYNQEKEGLDFIIDETGSATKVFWNSVVPTTIAGIGVATKSAGAILDEFVGDPVQYNTLGDYIMDLGEVIRKGGKEATMSVPEEWQKSVFDKDGYKDPRAWLNTMISGTGSVASMAALSQIGVPPSVTATIQGADMVYDSAEEAGLSEKERLLMSMSLAPIMGKLDDIGSNPYLKQFSAKIFGKALAETAEKIAAKEITPKMAMEAFGESLTKNGGRYIKEVGKNVARESLTEGGEQAVQIAGESIFNIYKGDKVAEGKGKYKNRDINAPGYWENSLKEVGVATVEGGIGSLIPVALSSSGISPAKVRLYKDLQDKNPVAIQGWYDSIDVSLENGDITQEQHQDYTEMLEFASKISKRIPDKITNPEARAQAANIIQQLDEKKQESEEADEAFKPMMEEDENKLKEELKAIFETNKATEPVSVEPIEPTPTTEETPELVENKEDVETKKVDIEKRRQEELDSADVSKGGKLPIQGYDAFYEEVNAKYDAELSALENKPESETNKKTEYEGPTVQRLSEEEERGRDRAGEINAESAILTERVHSAVAEKLRINPSNLSKGQITPEEENYLEKYAKEKGVWTDNLNEKYGDKPDDFGQENEVFYSEDGKTVTKLNSGVMNDNWLDFTDRIALHNHLFPEAPYTIVGYGRDSKGNFKAVLEQPFVHGTDPTDSEIETFMSENGFERITEGGDKSNDYINKTEGLIVEDLHRGNIIKTESGKLIVIDPIVSLDTEEKGFEGTREINKQKTISDGKQQPIKQGTKAKSNKKDSGVPKKEARKRAEKAKQIKKKAPKDNDLNKAYKAEVYDSYSQVLKFFIGGGKLNNEAFQSLFGKKGEVEKGKLGPKARKEAQSRIGLWNNKTGLSIDGLAHYMWENQENEGQYETDVFKNDIEEAIRAHVSKHGMAKTILDKINEQMEQQVPEDYFDFKEEANDIADNLDNETLAKLAEMEGEIPNEIIQQIELAKEGVELKQNLEAEHQAIQERFELEEEQRPEEEKLKNQKELNDSGKLNNFENYEEGKTKSRTYKGTESGVREIQPTSERKVGAGEISEPNRVVNSKSTREEWLSDKGNNGARKIQRSNGKPVIKKLFTGHKVSFSNFDRSYRGTGIRNQGGGIFFTINPLFALEAAEKSASGGYAFNPQTPTGTPFVSEVVVKGDNILYAAESIPNDVAKKIGVINGIDASKYKTYDEFLYDLQQSFVKDKVNFSDIFEAQDKAADALHEKGITGHIVDENEIVVYNESDIIKTHQTEIVSEPKIKVKPQEYEATKKAYNEAQEEYSAAKIAFEEKRKKLDKEILKDQENLFGERGDQNEPKLIDERVDASQREKAISKEKARLEIAEKNLKKAKDAWDKIKDKETGGIFGENETPTPLSQEQIITQADKIEEISDLEKVRDAKKTEMGKEDIQQQIDKIAETLPKGLIEKAKFVKENLANIREQMEKKNLLKVEC